MTKLEKHLIICDECKTENNMHESSKHFGVWHCKTCLRKKLGLPKY